MHTSIRVNDKQIRLELVDAPDDEFGRMLRPHGGRKAVIFDGLEIGHVHPIGPEQRTAHAMAGDPLPDWVWSNDAILGRGFDDATLIIIREGINTLMPRAIRS